MLRRSPIWSDPRVKPPYRAARLDRAHPLAQGLTWGLILNETAGAVTPTTLFSVTDTHGPKPVFTVTGTPTWSAGPSGPNLHFDGSSYFFLDCYNGSAAKPLFDFASVSVAVRVRRLGTGSGEEGIFVNQGIWRLTANSFGDQTARWLTFPSTRDCRTTSVLDGRDHDLAASVDPSTMRIAFDGRVEGSNTGDTLTGTDSTPYVANGLGSFFGNVYYVYFWNRALSVGEMAWLHVEPYAMLRPVIRRRYFVPTGAISTAKFRRTFSEFGTRTGTRQIVGGLS